MSKYRNIMFIYFIFISVILITFCLFYRINIMAVSNDDKIINFNIKNTNINTITNELYEKNLIKNRKVFKIYLDIFKVKNFKEGTFKLSKSMDVEEIVDTLTKKEE